MINRPEKKNVSIQQVLTALLDENRVFPVVYLQHLSDLEGADWEAFRSVWPQVKASRRLDLLEEMEDMLDYDTLVSFDPIALLALTDPDPRVRAVAVRLLWEYEDPALVPSLLKMLDSDSDVGVRAAAATGLGKFVYLGELEEIPEETLHTAEDALLAVMNSPDDPLVRRRTLESMGFSGRKEVPPLIRAAYETEDPDWISSALFAMGRSADAEWEPDVKRMLRNPKANIQLEAVRAAGELSLESTRRILLDLLEEEAQDSEIRSAVIWSLSQIGGEEVRETLEQLLEETEDEEETELLEDALDNLDFTEDLGVYSLFDFDQLGEASKEIDDLATYDQHIEDENSEAQDRTGTSSHDNERHSNKNADKNRQRHRKSH